MNEEKKLLTEKETSLLEELGLANFQDGFLIGVFIAIVLHLGIIKIITPFDKILAFGLLISGIVATVHQVLRRKRYLISAPWDGFISGFGVVLGIINIIETYLLPLLFR